MIASNQKSTIEKCTKLAHTVVHGVLGLEPTSQRISKMQGCIENLLMNEFPTPEKVYEQNCTIARIFIEDQLGLSPTPKRMAQCVDFIMTIESEEKE